MLITLGNGEGDRRAEILIKVPDLRIRRLISIHDHSGSGDFIEFKQGSREGGDAYLEKTHSVVGNQYPCFLGK